ncbi:MAG: amino acid-binding protein [Phycisphaerae bacterium]|nr:MAG: amino acid-binding protein [Phycisphaerae bacterium]
MIDTLIQFSVFLGNKPDTLGRVCRALATAKINIVALTMMDVTEHGVLRIVARNPDKARAVIKDMNLSMTEVKVLAVTMPNKPGMLADVCEKLSAHRVPISYLYSTTGAAGGKAIGIFKVQNMAKAIKVLESKRATSKDIKSNLRNKQRASGSSKR